MIVINKKRASIILSCLFISLFAFSFKIADNQNEKNENNAMVNTIETAATPISGKTIVVDAGHGVPDERDCLLTLNNNN